jgi:hypothetical protein
LGDELCVETTMSSQWMMMALIGGTMMLGACGDSGSSTQPATTQQRVEQDIHAAGQAISNAATQAASDVKPALDRAKEEGRQVIHNAAEKVAQSTASQPAP